MNAMTNTERRPARSRSPLLERVLPVAILGVVGLAPSCPGLGRRGPGPDDLPVCVVADFESTDANRRGGAMASHATGSCTVSTDITGPGDGSQPNGNSLRLTFGMADDGWAAWWTFLRPDRTGFPVGRYEQLEFRLRGERGGESFRLALTDTDDKATTLQLTRVLPAGAPPRWETVRIPLRFFNLRAIDARAVKSISLAGTGSGRTTVYLDDIALRTCAGKADWGPVGFSTILRAKAAPGFPPTPYGWLLSRVSPAGLVNSVDDGTPRAFAYSQALAVIAFTAGGDAHKARDILTALDELQDPDGSFAACYHARTRRVMDEARFTGNNAWVIMAMNYYAARTGDRSFLPMAQGCADWCLTMRDEATGGFRGGPGVTWYSAEHSADLYSAFLHLGRLAGEARFTDTAVSLLAFIDRFLHVPSPESGGNGKDRLAYWLGKGDFGVMATDPQTWLTLALAPTDYPRDQLLNAMQWLKRSHCRVKVDWDEVVTGIDGFDWDDFRLFPDNPHTPDRTRYPSDNVWFEGTEGAVAALRVLGMTEEADHFHGQTRRLVSDAGGIPYSTPHPDLFQRSNPALAVASTAWFVFNELGVNPFWPSAAAE